MSKTDLGLGTSITIFVLFWGINAALIGFGVIPLVAAASGVTLPFWPTLFTMILANALFGTKRVVK